jgi:hypothetical protein
LVRKPSSNPLFFFCLVLSSLSPPSPSGVLIASAVEVECWMLLRLDTVEGGLLGTSGVNAETLVAWSRASAHRLRRIMVVMLAIGPVMDTTERKARATTRRKESASRWMYRTVIIV